MGAASVAQVMFRARDGQAARQPLQPVDEWSYCDCCFHMPVNYPRYTRADYEVMPEWKLDYLFRDYGFPVVAGDAGDKRRFAMDAFLWPAAH